MRDVVCLFFWLWGLPVAEFAERIPSCFAFFCGGRDDNVSTLPMFRGHFPARGWMLGSQGLEATDFCSLQQLAQSFLCPCGEGIGVGYALHRGIVRQQDCLGVHP
jgi:hypothetical protein